MPGPNSAPNGDTTIVRGHANEEFIVEEYRVDGELFERLVPKREWLAKRNRLRTGKS